MNECNHDCSFYNVNRDSRKIGKGEFLEALNLASSVERVIGVVSGEGGVGKSLVTSTLAVSMDRKDKKTAALDVGITGLSIPMTFGIGNGDVATSPNGSLILPARSMEDVEIMSVNLLLDEDADPVIWRGPMIAGAVKQFWSETPWQDVGYMLVDVPPGIGDVSLTVLQSPPVDGIIIVTSPQELVGMIVAKAVNMAKKIDISTTGMVGNTSYLECPDCGKRIGVFGEGHVEEIVAERGIKAPVQIPIDPAIAQMVNAGCVGYLEMPWLDEAVKAVEAL